MSKPRRKAKPEPTHLVTIPLAGAIYLKVAAKSRDEAIAAAWAAINTDGFDPVRDGELEYEYMDSIVTGNVLHASINEIEVDDL